MKSQILLLVVLVFSMPLFATSERLILVGGGEYPADGMHRFVDAAGGSKAKILIVTWAGLNAQIAFKRIESALLVEHPSEIDLAPTAGDLPSQKQTLLENISSATGIFFTGGNQNRIMDVLSDADLFTAFYKRFTEGVVFGGSSAGTAIMSKTMFTGEHIIGVKPEDDVWKTSRGLGLLPDFIIVDTHFIIRHREKRLENVLVHHHETEGLGIDQDGALDIRLNNEKGTAEVLGSKNVILMDKEINPALIDEKTLHPGDKFDL